MTTILEHLQSLNKGDKIFLILTGIAVNGIFEEVADNCVVLTDATSPSMMKSQPNLTIPLENIYAWGLMEKKNNQPYSSLN